MPKPPSASASPIPSQPSSAASFEDAFAAPVALHELNLEVVEEGVVAVGVVGPATVFVPLGEIVVVGARGGEVLAHGRRLPRQAGSCIIRARGFLGIYLAAGSFLQARRWKKPWLESP